MATTAGASAFLTFLLGTIAIYGVITVVVKYMWPFLVQNLFPGAVKQNLIAKDIPWGIALILAILLGIMAG